MPQNKIPKGKSQVMFNYLINAVFPQDEYWFKVKSLDVKKLDGETKHLLDYVLKYVESWVANNELDINLYPRIPDMYYFGEIEKANFDLFPLVFYCKRCGNVHPYEKIEELNKINIELKCKFCGQGRLKQYPYVLIHANGDIKSINVKGNSDVVGWKAKYDGIRMIDTRSFKTATWYNYKKKQHIDELGTKTTLLPLTRSMKDNNKRRMSGTHISDGSVYYPALYSFVNLKQEELVKRKEHDSFAFIEIAALLQLDSIEVNNFSSNFESKNENVLHKLLTQVNSDISSDAVALKDSLLKFAQKNGMNLNLGKDNLVEQVQNLFHNSAPVDRINNDRHLHEFIYTWYECGGETLEEKIKEAKELHDFTQESVYSECLKNIRKFGLQSAKLVEEFPVLTMGIGFTRKSADRTTSVLNPFRQKIGEKEKILIPLLSNRNEAIIFKLEPLKVLAWLVLNDLIDLQRVIPKTSEEAHAILYEYLLFSLIEEEELTTNNFDNCDEDKRKVATIMTFQLIHSYLHGLLQAGKAIIGLDIDSISEYLFPSALSGAIYVSKLQGGGMGALIAAFENDLSRWMNALYEKVNTCLYDPVCHQHTGACHACMYLKFSCRYFNHGLTRNVLVGGRVYGYKENKSIIGYYDHKVDVLVDQWRNG